MKKIVNIILSAAAITGIVTPAAASSKTEVRETIELVSALARTADFREYKTNIYPEYTAMIDSVTAPYKNHPAVTMIKSLRDSLGLGYDAVASFAGALAIKDGNVVFNPELDYKPMIDRRWGETGAEELVPLLNDFYHKTNFNEVYRKGQPIYEKAIANFNKMLDGVDMNMAVGLLWQGIHGTDQSEHAQCRQLRCDPTLSRRQGRSSHDHRPDSP